MSCTCPVEDHGDEHDDHGAGRFSRRGFLALAGAGGAAIGVSAIGNHYAFATPEAPATGDVIVIVFNRGGMDGLNVVAPYRMPSYQQLRPTIRVRPPEEFADPTGKAGLPLDAGGAVAPFALSGAFGFHPGMDRLHQGAWANGDLAIVQAVGMPASESATRSHFESQRNWEAGTARLGAADGFLNRYLQSVPGLDRLGAMGRGSTLQAMLHGPAPAFSVSSIGGFGVRGFADNTRARAALVAMYPQGADLVTSTGAETLSITGLVAGIPADPGPQNGASYGNDGLSNGLREAARLIRANVGLRAVVVDDGGWDTHTTMGAPEDPAAYFRGRLAAHSNALQAFYQDLGAAMSEVTLVTLTEFGRTINENSSGGTDHGRGTVMMVMGANVNGGVHGSFPSAVEQGPEGDLQVVTDYRRVVSEVLTTRCGVADAGAVFPTYGVEAPLGVVAA
jgi:uncharacterized protein (DUF1501 family)